jgi:hypothetical protein
MTPATVDPATLGAKQDGKAADSGLSLDVVNGWQILGSWNDFDALGSDFGLSIRRA